MWILLRPAKIHEVRVRLRWNICKVTFKLQAPAGAERDHGKLNLPPAAPGQAVKLGGEASRLGSLLFPNIPPRSLRVL